MSRVLRHIKEGFQGVTRHFAMALSSISSVTVTLVIMAFFLLLSSNVELITLKLEQSVQIHVLISKDVTQEEEFAALQTEIEFIPGVQTVTFSDKHAEFEAWIENVGAEKAEQLYGGYRGENNPMLDAFIVETYSGSDLKEITEQINVLEGIEEVNYGGDTSTSFISTLSTIRNFGFGIVVALAVIAVFLISNTIRATIHSRRKEISIMRTVGATNWYIRWPFIIEGMIIGLIGSIIPIALTIFGYRYIYVQSGGFLISKMFELSPVYPLVFEISIVLAVIGMGVGAIGSLFSVGKQLRWTR